MRQRAWLHAVPKTPSRSISTRGAAKELSRWEDYKEKGLQPPLPEVICDYLIKILFEVGPIDCSGFGGRLTDAALTHWQWNNSVRLQPWECKHLIRLSSVWLEEFKKAEDPEYPAPYAVITHSTRELVARKVDAAFG